MKQAEKILRMELNEDFDLLAACNKAESFFYVNKAATATVILVAKYFSHEYEDDNFHGFLTYFDDALSYLMQPYCKVCLEKIKIESLNIGILEVDAPAIREVVKEMKKRGFYTKRKDNGIYLIQAE